MAAADELDPYLVAEPVQREWRPFVTNFIAGILIVIIVAAGVLSTVHG